MDQDQLLADFPALTVDHIHAAYAFAAAIAALLLRSQELIAAFADRTEDALLTLSLDDIDLF
jgi:hypothetical protein